MNQSSNHPAAGRALRRGSSLVAIAAASFLALPAMAADAADDQPATTTAQTAEDAAATIVVTGTRRTDRTVAESPVPIDVFSANDIKVQASPQLQTILKNLVPSFNQNRNALGDASAFVRPPNLRGLPPDQILVLINGKRMHRTALVSVAGGALSAGSQGADLSQISAPSIGRVEVLRDGAAAQYGSDAIAGVINIGLNRADNGYTVNARYGQTYQGDGEDLQVSANAGFKLGDGGFFNLTGEFIDQKVWDRSFVRPEIPALIAGGVTPKWPTGNRRGQPENRAYRVVWNSELPVGDGDAVYFFGNYGWQRQGNDFNIRRPFGVTVPAEDSPPLRGSFSFGKSVPTAYLDQIGITADGTPLFDINGDTYEVSETFPNGFVPFFEGTNEDMSAVVGYKGETGFGMTFDFSAAYGRNMIRYFMGETVNPSFGPDSPTDFYLGKFVQTETNLNADFSYEVEAGMAKPLFFAGGLEFRREVFETGLGDRASWDIGPFANRFLGELDEFGNAVQLFNSNGTPRRQTQGIGSNGFVGFGPDSVVEGGRNSYSIYADVEATPVDGFDIGVAARYDYFNDFGSTFNGKISARYAPNDIIAFRGAASTGFRAPTPGQQFTQNVTTGFPGGSPTPVAIATAQPASITAQFFGAEPLTPEKSVSFSGGLVLTPGSGFNVTLDYYNITVRDRIGITGQFIPTLDEQTQLDALGVPGAFDLGRVRYFTNGFKTRTQGVDLVVTHRADTDIGNFNTSLAVNYNDTKVLETKLTPDGRELIDAVRRGNIERSLPRWRAVLSETYTNGMFDFTGRVNYFGNYTSFNEVQGIPAAVDPVEFREIYLDVDGAWPKTFRSDWSFDAEIGVTFAERHRFAIGVENLFDRYPERETRNVFPSTGGQANGNGYADSSPLGYMGGFWYVRAQVKF